MAALPRLDSEEDKARFADMVARVLLNYKPTPPDNKGGPRFDEYAFPCADDAYDHNPNAELTLNLAELLASPVPRLFDLNGPSMTSEDLTKIMPHSPRLSQTMSSQLVGFSGLPVPWPGNELCVFSFGAGDEKSTWSCIFSDPQTRVVMRAHPLFNEWLFIEPQASKHAFRIGDTPDGRGKALYATRAIPRNEIIMREPPLVVLPMAISSDIISNLDELLDKGMHDRARKALDSLSDCWPPNRFSRRFGIMRTNGFGINMPRTDQIFGGVFEIMARANHSCDPNTLFSWDVKTFQGALIADRHIKAGDEITVSYLTPTGTTAVRREELQRKYNFKCTCMLCGPV